MSYLENLNNLAITTTNGSINWLNAYGFNKLESLIGSDFKNSPCRFYYDYDKGGSVLMVIAKGLVNNALAVAKRELERLYGELLSKKNKKEVVSTDESIIEKQKEEQKNYGKILVLDNSDKEQAVYALDDFGYICPDALMLSIDTDNQVTVKQEFPTYASNHAMLIESQQNKNEVGGSVTNEFKTKTLVWYDTTAIININSSKNIIATQVQGRDYSRKELVSNGDIKFSVSGQITSKIADIYPTEEVQKFIKVMQYKGIVKISNQVLDQFGISRIIITDFNLPSKEGYKSTQQYSFNAIGLQPEKETVIEDDTVVYKASDTVKEDNTSAWRKMFESQLEGYKETSKLLVSQGLTISTSLLDAQW